MLSKAYTLYWLISTSVTSNCSIDSLSIFKTFSTHLSQSSSTFSAKKIIASVNDWSRYKWIIEYSEVFVEYGYLYSLNCKWKSNKSNNQLILPNLKCHLKSFLPCWNGETKVSENSSGESGGSPSDNKQSWTPACHSFLFNNFESEFWLTNYYKSKQVI